MDQHEHFIQSSLIVSPDEKSADSYITGLLKEKEIDPIDINIQTYDKDLGIEDVRNIQKKILLKPLKSKTKALVLKTYQDITTEAQNALLKILEEPPANTLIIIVVAKKELILSTIISRCKIITLEEEKGIVLSENEIQRFQDNLNILIEEKTGDKLKLAEITAKDKEKASLWLQKMIFFLRGKLIEENYNSKYLIFLKEFQKAYKDIKSTNVGTRTALENLFLSLEE